jgi:signal transduction histidine kinase/streptogramin lyase
MQDGLPGEHTTGWLQDQEGNIWVSLANAGIARLRPNYFQVLGQTPGLPLDPATTVCEDHAGVLWFGTYGGGLYRWQNDALTHFPILSQTPGDFVFSIYPDARDQLWLSAGLEDAVLFQKGNLQPPPTAVHAIKCLLVDRQGRVWMGRKDGLDCWADGRLREWSSHTGSIAKPVRVIIEDRQGVIWMGADDENIYSANGDNLQAIPLPAFSAHQAVWSMLADADGSLWIGTSDAGLLHYDHGRFTRFTAADGLPDNLICQMLDDQQGNLWIGTHHGIARLNKASLQAFADGQIPDLLCSIYDRSDGLPAQQCADMYQPAAWRAHDGRLWFATAKGVVGVQPGEMPSNTRPPPVVIEALQVDGNTQPPTVAAAPVKLSAGSQNFMFQYTALSLTEAGKIRFRYQLEGFDQNWINADSRRWVQYNYLPPGRYRFRVAACNNDGVWNETGATLALQILPYFWQTWWFVSLLAGTLLAGVAGVVRQISHRSLRRELERLERQRNLERERARIARDIHDHVGSGLTRINLLGELLLCDPVGNQAERVGQITGAACELLRAMDEIVWAVNPKNDTLDCLMSYLCDFAGEYLRLANIRLRLDLPASLPAWPLTSEVRHNLFLAVKEILNNIVKHSQAGDVALSLKLEPGLATLKISDNGRGFSPAANGAPVTDGNGLENLHKRAASIGGRCLIFTEPGRGTRIELSFPGQNDLATRPPTGTYFKPTTHSPPCPSPFPSSKTTPPPVKD